MPAQKFIELPTRMSFDVELIRTSEATRKDVYNRNALSPSGPTHVQAIDLRKPTPLSKSYRIQRDHKSDYSDSIDNIVLCGPIFVVPAPRERQQRSLSQWQNWETVARNAPVHYKSTVHGGRNLASPPPHFSHLAFKRKARTPICHSNSTPS